MKTFFLFLSENNTWNNWLWFAGIIMCSALVGRLMVWIEKRFLRARAEKTKTKIDDLLLNVLQLPFVCGLVLFGIYVAIHMLVLPASAYGVIKMSFKVLLVLDIAWVINRFIKNILNDFLLPYAESNKNSKLDINVIRAIQKVSSGLIWVVAIITMLTMVGIDVAAMLTTLGIGGIAFALAAQDTIKNMFGGVTIFMDKPFKLGERIKVAGFDGMVEDIGMRSTRIRTLEGRLVTIPNYKIVDSEIENALDIVSDLTTIDVTYAVRNATVSGKSVLKGDFMAISGKELLSSGGDKVLTAVNAISNVEDIQDKELLTVFFGSDVTSAEKDLFEEEATEEEV